jgi:two-component system NtrC family sensor kinase
MTGGILIVDDSLTVRMDLAEILGAAGLSTVACATGDEARKALANDQFSLVILDVLLPDADGIDLLKEIREMPSARGTAVMLLSTEAEIRHRIRGLTTGADEYIGKPYEPNYVVARARELAGRGQTAAPSAQETVLVIDDSVTFREALKEALEGASYRVLIAGTGEEGLRIASDMRPGGIIVDGVLPGIDGRTVIRRIRLDVALRRVPCLLLTASEDSGAEIQALDAGADAFVRKGEDIAVILARLSAVLRSAASPGEDQATASPLASKKLLAVDDSETYLQELAGALRGDGYEVVLARSGEEALELLAVQPVECILLDLLMPGIGGEETCRRVKAVPVMRDIPIVMLTALDNRDAMIKGLDAGADDYIAKSSEFGVLRARVQALIRRKQFEDENRVIREQFLRRELAATEARAIERKLQDAELARHIAALERSNKELDDFAYIASHDLKEPLRGLFNNAKFLLEDYRDKLAEDGVNRLQRLGYLSQRMERLINDLLYFSRLGRQELAVQPTDLDEVIRDIEVMSETTLKERNVTIVIPRPLPRISCDTTRIAEVFRNLIINAAKYNDNDVRRIEIGYLPTVETTGGLENDVFYVKDNGIGIAEEFHEDIFRIFKRLNSEDDDKKGNGVGLTFVRKIIERHGGRIWIHSVPGEGATFYFTIGQGAASKAAA